MIPSEFEGHWISGDSNTATYVETQTLEPPKSLHQEAHDLARSLAEVRFDLHVLRGEPAFFSRAALAPEASLTQIILHCKWLSGEIIGQLDLVRQETGRIG